MHYTQQERFLAELFKIANSGFSCPFTVLILQSQYENNKNPLDFWLNFLLPSSGQILPSLLTPIPGTTWRKTLNTAHPAPDRMLFGLLGVKTHILTKITYRSPIGGRLPSRFFTNFWKQNMLQHTKFYRLRRLKRLTLNGCLKFLIPGLQGVSLLGGCS